MFGPFGCASGSERTLRSELSKRERPPGDWPIAIGRTPSSTSVLAVNGVSATMRFGGAAAAGPASAVSEQRCGEAGGPASYG